MTNIKSYTNLEQSKKLAEILPLESADMKWYFWKSEIDAPKTPTFGYSKTAAENYKDTEAIYLPCWSLAALLNILAKIASKIDDDGSADLSSFMGQWSVNMFDCPVEATDNYDNPIDACVAMIEKLHELNLL